MPRMPTQIIRYEASAGVICSTMTNNAVIHISRPTPPVWLSAIRHTAITLRG